MTSREALDKAREADLDLVMVAPNGKPPVCKIIDYGKYRYELARKEKEAKKKQKTIEIVFHPISIPMTLTLSFLQHASFSQRETRSRSLCVSVDVRWHICLPAGIYWTILPSSLRILL